MSQIRFQHVFLSLMTLSAISSFAIPSRYTDKVHPGLSLLIAPVARPIGAIAAWLYRRLGADRPADPRDADVIRRENQELKGALAAMSIQVQELERRNAEREKLGPIKDLCTPVAVVGFDTGSRESLSLRASTLSDIRPEMCVLYENGIVGQIERSGPAGVQVRLITDPGFRLRGNFGLFQRRPDNQIEFVKLNAPTALVEGAGHDRMIIRGLSVQQVKDGNVAVGNWVFLAEPDWPEELQGQRLGIVTKITPRPDAPLFAEITVEPKSNLSRLREVMVVTKGKE